MKYRIIIPAYFAAAAVLLAFAIQREKPPAEKLSDYGLFTGKLADLVPAADLVPYDLNTPLFTDYAESAGSCAWRPER
jgi:hypothetical protein